MLQSIRERAQGWLAWLIVGLISIPFALWGINSYFNNAADVSVAKVNGAEISLSQYQNALQNYRQRLQSMFGENFDLNQMDQETLKRDVINALVEQQLLLHTAQKSGMRISDEQLAGMIHSLDSFHDESGRFSNAVYERRLLQSSTSPVAFEQQLRNDMVQEQLRQGISDSAFVTQREKDTIKRLLGQKRNIIYTTINAEQYLDTVAVTEDEIKAYYERHLENYKTDESVKINYLDLSVSELAKNLSVSSDDLQKYYENNLDKYTLEERRVAHHIVVALPPDAKAEDVKKAKQSADRLYELVKTGIDFDEIPQKHADLLGAQDEVAKSGAMSRGVMAPEFDDALFSMKIGEIHEPVRSKHGFHVIKLAEIQESKVSTFDEVKDSVEDAYRKELAEKAFFDKADELQNLVFENPDTLEVAAETLELEIKTSDSFTRNKGEGITLEPKVIEAAFSQEVLDGANSEPLELADTHIIVLRVKDHELAAVKQLEIVRDEIVDSLKNEKAKKLAEERGVTILSMLKEGVDPEQIAHENTFEWTKKEAVTRDDPNVKRAILRSAFKLGRPADKRTLFDGFTLGRFDYAIIGVTSVNDSELKGKEAETSFNKAVEELQQQKINDAWSDLISSIKEDADIEITSETL